MQALVILIPIHPSSWNPFAVNIFSLIGPQNTDKRIRIPGGREGNNNTGSGNDEFITTDLNDQTATFRPSRAF